MTAFNRFLGILGAAAALAACGGGGGGGSDSGGGGSGGTGTTPLAVISTSPASGATGASRAAAISVTFDRTVDCSSVTATSFTVVDASLAAVGGTTTCSGATASFTPTAILVRGAQYTASVAGTIRDAGGVTLTGAINWSFTTNSADKTAVPVVGGITNLAPVAVGAESAGNYAIMLYRRQVDATHYALGAMRYYKPNAAWDSHSELGTDVDASGPVELAVNKYGYALALWRSYDTRSLYYAYYNPYSNSWSGKTPIASAVAIESLDAAIDDNGNAMATWTINDGAGGRRVHARYYQKSAVNWRTAQDVSASDYPSNQRARFAFDSSGNGMVVYDKYRWIAYGGYYQITLSSLTYDAVADTWSDPVDIAADATHPDIGFDASGNAVAVWVKKFRWQDDPEATQDYYGVGGATRAPGGDWDASWIGVGWDPKGNASEPRVAVTSGGDAMAVWRFTRGNGYFYNINAAYLPAGATAWVTAGENAVPVGGDNYSSWRVVWGDGAGADAVGPQLVIDANGKATLVYTMNDGTRSNVHTRSFTWAARVAGSVSGWTPVREIDASSADATGAVVTVAGTGVTLTAWDQADSGILDFWYLRE